VYDQNLVNRIREYFSDHQILTEQAHSWGLAFLIDGHLCVGASEDRLMARVGDRFYEKALKNPYTSVTHFTSKPLRGFVCVEPEGITTDEQLFKWIKHCETVVKQLPPKPSIH
jgi:hypothetical protein